MPFLANQIIKDAAEVFNRNLPLWKELAGKRVLITGGTGILGLNLMAVLSLVNQTHKLGSLSYTSVQNYSFPNKIIDDIAPGSFWWQADLTRNTGEIMLPEVDVLIHAAGYGQPAKFMADPVKTIALNTTVMIYLNRHLAKGGKALYVSSSEIYSGNDNTPHHEDYVGKTAPQHPRGAYIESKRCGEALATAFSATGKTWRSARVSLSYGPGTRKNDDRVLNQFIKQALLDGSISCKDGGYASRTYNYVSDAVEMMFNILLRGSQPVYNVGGVSTLTIRQLATTIARLTGTVASFPEENGQNLVSAPAVVKSSISRYQDEFGRKAFVNMVDGLTRTINWQKILYGKV
jgi:nucleoside-diphosphate-sugar epimerase